LLCAILSTTLLPQQPLLLERASKRADVCGWWPRQDEFVDYRWLSDTVLLSGTGTWRLENPFLYDIATHRKTALTRLGKLLKKDNDMGTNDWELSPDGRWLLWTMELYSDVRAARLDGSGFQITTLPPPGNAVGIIGWEQDGRHWRAEGFDYSSEKMTNLFGGDVDTPGKRHSLPLSGDKSFIETKYAGDLMRDYDTNSIEVERPVAGRTSDTAPTVILHPPQGTKVEEAVQSEDRVRIAWLVVGTHTSLFSRWVHRLVPQYAASRATAELWLSRSDGRAMHELGYIPLKGDSDEAEKPHDLVWLPSGRAISFLYKDALWTLPIS
jgi:hypothetical protein